VNNTNGFSLVELMVTITIIGVLSAIALPKFSDIIAKSRFTNVVTIVYELNRSQDIYEMENGFYAEPQNTSEFKTYFNIDISKQSNNFDFSFTLLPTGLNYSLKAEVKNGIGGASAGDYLRVDKDLNKWYHGTYIKKYAESFLSDGDEE